MWLSTVFSGMAAKVRAGGAHEGSRWEAQRTHRIEPKRRRHKRSAAFMPQDAKPKKVHPKRS